MIKQVKLNYRRYNGKMMPNQKIWNEDIQDYIEMTWYDWNNWNINNILENREKRRGK